MNKLKFILTASIAAILTLSCGMLEDSKDDKSSDSSGDKVSSSSKGNGGGSSSGSTTGITKTYDLVDKTSDQFTYEEKYDICTEGKFKPDSSEYTFNYSIKNNVLSAYTYSEEDTLNFKGTSNKLVGTWTRTKSSCEKVVYDTYCSEYNYDACIDLEHICSEYDEFDDCIDYGSYYCYDEEFYYDDSNCLKHDEVSYNHCKDGYDITKAVVTEENISITRNACPNDVYVNGNDIRNGWKIKVVDCNTYEISKGSDKITVKQDGEAETYTYKSKSCKYDAPSKDEKAAACASAWDRYQDEDYMWILRQDFNDCLNDLLPEDYLYCDSYDCWADKILAKPAAKDNTKDKVKKDKVKKDKIKKDKDKKIKEKTKKAKDKTKEQK